MRQAGLFIIAIFVGTLPILCTAQQVMRRQPGNPVRHFVAVRFDTFPDSVIRRDFCDSRDNQDEQECLQEIRSAGRAWSADINGDGIMELMVQVGSREAGSSGMGFHLYQHRETDWQRIANAACEGDWSGDCEGSGGEGWGTDRPRLDILPRSHKGYSDLRVAVDVCLRWNGAAYVPYAPADYRALSSAWFDDKDPREAEIFWKIRYAGSAGPVRLEPQWFPMTPCFYSGENAVGARTCPWRERLKTWFAQLGDLPRPNEARGALNDTEQDIRWVSFARAGIWGIRGRRGYLLVPRTSYLGACRLILAGEWLAGSEGCEKFKLRDSDFRYNRHTRELKVAPSR